MTFFTEWDGEPIHFSFSHCRPSKDYNLTKANDATIEIKLFDILRDFEGKNMAEIHKLPREKWWWTPERMGSENYEYLSANHYWFENYYHFRIKQDKLARVFVGTDWKSNIIYVLFIDGKGKLNHK